MCCMQGLVSLVLLCRVNSRYLLDACNAKAIPTVERLARDKDTYVKNAVSALQDEAAEVITSITQQVRGAPASFVYLLVVRRDWYQWDIIQGRGGGGKPELSGRLLALLPSFPSS